MPEPQLSLHVFRHSRCEASDLKSDFRDQSELILQKVDLGAVGSLERKVVRR